MGYYITIKDILDITNGKLICGDENKQCKKFSKDTRTIKSGDTYIGIKGEKFDGSNFWKEALVNGANTVIIENIKIEENELENFKDKNIIEVSDTLDALYKIAALKRSKYDIPVIAITGSVGKTSTKDIVYSVVSQKYKTLKTQGNNNNNIGMPLTILNLEKEEAIVLEMGMNHLGEISLLSKIAKPTISVIINVGTAHIGNLGSRENILKAKLEILDGMEEKVLVINNDNDLLHNWYEENINPNKKIYTYGINNNSLVQAEEILLNENGSKFKCKYKEDEFEINVNIGGEHFIYNSLCAITIGKILNIENEKIIKGIEEAQLTKNRMDIQEIANGVKIINDSYNASFEAVKALLEHISRMNSGRKIAVLGDMLELGNYSEELHRKVGVEVVKNNIDILICSGENSKYIVEEAIKQGMKKETVYYEENNENIINRLKEILEPQDVVLIKASNGMRFYEIIEKLK